MSSTPPARRRVNPAVTVRRAQSERRQQNPWHLPWPLCPPGHTPGNEPPWTGVVDHHHTPRTALIPPAVPRMVGHSQTVLRGGESPTGSVRNLPLAPVSSLQLPPMALGTPPMMLLPPQTLEDRLAQDRLSAFLAAETLPHQPRSILSCPEEPLYESLLSIFESEDAMTTTETEHEYQQIQVSRGSAKEDRSVGEALEEEQQKGGGRKSSSPAEENQQGQPQKIKVRKLNTLDVKPECHKTGPENKCSCHSSSSVDELWESVDSSPVQSAKNSSHSASSQDSHKSAILVANKATESESEVTDSDIYEDASLAPTVIHISPSDRSSDRKISKSSESISCKKSSIQHNQDFSTSETEYPVTPGNNSSNSASTKSNVKTSYSIRSNSDEPAVRVQVAARTKPPDPVYPPLTIELPESKPSPRKPEPARTTKNKSTQASLDSTPHIITTLDHPIKHKSKANKSHSQYNGHTDQRDKVNKSHSQLSGQSDLRDKANKAYSQTSGQTDLRDKTSKSHSPQKGQSDSVPPLIVNFDSENSESEDGLVSDCDSCSSTLAGSTTIYLTEDEGDTSSIYSSVAEVYSVLTTDSESLVYVYRPPPRRRRHRYSTLSYRFPTSGSSGGSSGSGSSSQEDTITFVEPSYRPSNLSVGSRGHLKIDYSWSWNRLDDFVRTTSPREAGSDDNPYSVPLHNLLGFHLMPWERPLDLVAG